MGWFDIGWPEHILEGKTEPKFDKEKTISVCNGEVCKYFVLLLGKNSHLLTVLKKMNPAFPQILTFEWRRIKF